jgi:crotonobetainyl-CoA:carnitine CoA-transferase CaiB-like acyl-CoA transferase
VPAPVAPWLADDPRFSSNAARVGHRDALTATLAPAIALRRKEELLAALAAAGVPAVRSTR